LPCSSHCRAASWLLERYNWSNSRDNRDVSKIHNAFHYVINKWRALHL